ncbi:MULTISPECIES: GmrSD restriction endonuclease domain-containing protein [unclassified Sphingomonas]|uniref:GmrSD restriction endonuclease domain-containing protein n=1 Tax=Sphingomonas sp. PvP015 TaxID=3156388 RepID=UPI003399D67E
MAGANVVNLDALIKRADLASRGEEGEDITSLSVSGLEQRGFLYPALRKPDFQRETSGWSPEQVADLVGTFVRRDLIPAVILWRAGQNVFVIDGAHRLSALIAWVHDDYGDGNVSRAYFHNLIPDDQARAATRARELVDAQIGSYQAHKIAIDYPEAARPDIAGRAQRIGWQDIQAQWIRNADHEKAETSFFRINQGGTKIDAVEQRILKARNSAPALAARAVIRGGTGNKYWSQFRIEIQEQIGRIGADVHRLLFEPALILPIKTLDVPLGGSGYGPKTLPFIFDLINLINDSSAASSANRKTPKDDFKSDETGDETLTYLRETRRVLRRLCSNHPSSLGLHPALYFYARGGTFQAGAIFAMVELIKSWDTTEYHKFTDVRRGFEEFLLANRNFTEAVRRLGSGSRSRPRIVSLYRLVLAELELGRLPSEIASALADDTNYDFLVATPSTEVDFTDASFSRDAKGGAFIQSALPHAPQCPTCGGLLHHNGMQVGHVVAKRDGGAPNVANSMMQHPFCNSTVKN